MLEFNLPDMSCGHCVAAVTQTVRQVDPKAKVDVDLNAKIVKIESAEDRASIAAALTQAGYPPAA